MNQQQGAALISILLVMVLATILSIAMTTEQHFAISRARTLFEQTILRQYVLGGEELARQILYQDFIAAPEIDYLQEGWASLELQFAYEQGEVELLIEDLQGRLNINALIAPGEGGVLAKQRLTALFNEQGIDTALIDRIVDWLDADDTETALGAEDYHYLNLDPPYRTGNQPMTDISELRLLLEMDQTTLIALSPYITVLPDSGSDINLNTALPQVLQAVAPGLNLAIVESIVEARNATPFAHINDFIGRADLGATAQQINVNGLSVQSSFFQVQVRAKYQGRFGYLISVIQRNATDGSLRVIYRDQSKKILPRLEIQGEVQQGVVSRS